MKNIKIVSTKNIFSKNIENENPKRKIKNVYKLFIYDSIEKKFVMIVYRKHGVD
jgi:hypothetical protein